MNALFSLFSSLVAIALLNVLVTYELSVGIGALAVSIVLIVLFDYHCCTDVRRKTMFNIKNATRFIGLIVCLIPMFAVADAWDQTLVSTGRSIRIGMYLVAGTIALVTIVWSGTQWMIARVNGDHSHSFMDYLKQLAVIGTVGAGIGLAAWAWQIFGTGNPT